ncbi:hypothetical protein M3Y96_00061900 [Aphelenchoides besseyi]|nr:hypothetical protein M3Y96_00061900 [Aphelenchoides besseyi]
MVMRYVELSSAFVLLIVLFTFVDLVSSEATTSLPLCYANSKRADFKFGHSGFDCWYRILVIAAISGVFTSIVLIALVAYAAITRSACCFDESER